VSLMLSSSTQNGMEPVCAVFLSYQSTVIGSSAE
jgi:hypothetical protein